MVYSSLLIYQIPTKYPDQGKILELYDRDCLHLFLYQLLVCLLTLYGQKNNFNNALMFNSVCIKTFFEYFICLMF